MFMKMPQTHLSGEEWKGQNAQGYHMKMYIVNSIKSTRAKIQMFIMVIMYNKKKKSFILHVNFACR